MEKSQPIYILEKPVISPYKDFIKLHFNLNKIFYLVVILFTVAISILNIFFTLLGYSYFNLIIYIIIGLIILLLAVSLFLLPGLQRRLMKNKDNKEYIEFYIDSLVVHYLKKGVEGTFKMPFDQLKKKKSTKCSYLLYYMKSGIVLSKDNDYPKELKEKLDILTSKK